MYTIVLESSNELKTTISENIIEKNKNVDFLHFLVNPTYKGMDMSDFEVTMEYTSPISKTYRTENLILSEDLYNDYLEYKLPLDTDITKEAGKVEAKLTFTKVEKVVENDKEVVKQYVRHTTPTYIKIIPCASWSDMIPDAALASLDQRLLKTDAMINNLKEVAEVLDNTKADDMVLEGHILRLLSNNKKIGTEVDLSKSTGGDSGSSNIEVVNF